MIRLDEIKCLTQFSFSPLQTSSADGIDQNTVSHSHSDRTFNLKSKQWSKLSWLWWSQWSSLPCQCKPRRDSCWTRSGSRRPRCNSPFWSRRWRNSHAPNNKNYWSSWSWHLEGEGEKEGKKGFPRPSIYNQHPSICISPLEWIGT